MNSSYELGCRYLFSVLDCMVEQDMVLSDAKQDVSAKHPEWARAYSESKNSMFVDSISASVPVSSGLTYDQLVASEQKRLGCSQQAAARLVMATEAGKKAFLERVSGK